MGSITTDIAVPGYTKQYVRNLTYDSYGRLETASLPSGITIKQQYNSRGYLSAIVDNDTSQALQSFNQANQFGVTQETYGNGIATTRSFNPKSGRIESINSLKNSTVIQDLDVAWRSDGSLQSRFSTTNGGTVREEQFSYDPLNRLQQAKTYINSNPQRDLDYSYNKLGNLLSKTSSVSGDTDVTGYQYGTTTRPHAVSQASIDGNSVTLSYDLNGAVTQYDFATGPDKFIEYNAINQPTLIVVGTSLNDTDPEGKDEFRYGPDGERYYKKSTYRDSSSNQQVEHTFYVGAFEEIVLATDAATDSIKKSRIGQNILHIQEKPTVGNATFSIEYLHRDHLGSVESVTDAGGAVLQQLAFEPYGARRNSDWLSNISATEEQALLDDLNIRTSRGYTGHEHLDRTGFIHMNGRLYDPTLGRFLSPDPIVQSPTNSQSWNRYTYVFNNPLSYTDPSGYSGMDGPIITTDYSEPISSFRGDNGSFLDLLDSFLPAPDWYIYQSASRNQLYHFILPAVEGCRNGSQFHCDAVKRANKSEGWRFPSTPEGNSGSGGAVDGGTTEPVTPTPDPSPAPTTGNSSGGGLNSSPVPVGVVVDGAQESGRDGQEVVGNLVNGGGLFSSAALLRFLSSDGTQWKGKNGKWNSLSWGGNKWTGARSEILRRANKIRAAGQGLFVLGTGLSVLEGANAFANGDSGGVLKAGSDIGFGTAASFGGPAGLVGGITYFGTSALVNIPAVRDVTVTPIVNGLCSATGNC